MCECTEKENASKMHIDISSEGFADFANYSMCEGCIHARAKARTCHVALSISFVTLIVFSISTSVVAYFHVTMLNERLRQTDENFRLLSQRFEFLERSIHTKSLDDNIRPLEITQTEQKVTDVTQNDVLITYGGVHTLAANNNHLRISRQKRNVRAKRAQPRKKNFKNCLPSIQIEGSGLLSTNLNKTDLRGFWIPSDWTLSEPQFKKFFDIQDVNKNGQIKIKTAGLYFLYTQIYVIGTEKTGFHIFKKRDNQTKIVATCKQYTQGQGTEKSQTCQTMKVLKLEANDIIYINEIQGNSGVHLLPTSTYCGLIKLG